MAVTTRSIKKPSKKNLLTKACKNYSADNFPSAEAFYQPLLAWYDHFGRQDLPWKKNQSPYPVWLSEIMLQQTQVTTVVPYFYRFIDTFPTIESLAMADPNQVLALWSGLGYYARARNLHRTAQRIATEYAGLFPNTLDTLISLPGIGRSTAGAILAQSFNQFGVILDGNVKRVLTRYLSLKPTPSQTTKQFDDLLWRYATHFTPTSPHQLANYTQAIMDLGATLCTRTQPKCEHCPLHQSCRAKLSNTQAHFPVKALKKIKPEKKAKWLVFHHQSRPSAVPTILLSLRPLKGIWGGLWSFPEYPVDKPYPKALGLIQWLKKAELLALSTPPKNMTTFAPQTHVFTHFKLAYEILVINLTGKRPKILASQETKWYKPTEIVQIGLPSPITKTLNQIGFFTHDSP